MFKKIIATFCALVFSAMLTGCGTQMGEDIRSDISSMMPSATDDSSQQSSTDSAQQNSTTSEAKITKERAKEIALEHANIKETDITDYEIDLDNEDGKLVYEISFESNGKEYDYDVDATTGKVTNSMYELID